MVMITLLLRYFQTYLMAIYADKERVITDNQMSCQFLHSSYIDITLLIILAVPSSAVYWSTSVFVVNPSFPIQFSTFLVTIPRAPMTTGITSIILNYIIIIITIINYYCYHF